MAVLRVDSDETALQAATITWLGARGWQAGGASTAAAGHPGAGPAAARALCHRCALPLTGHSYPRAYAADAHPEQRNSRGRPLRVRPQTLALGGEKRRHLTAFPCSRASLPAAPSPVSIWLETQPAPRNSAQNTTKTD